MRCVRSTRSPPGAANATAFELTVSGPADAYRSFDQQKTAFDARYREVSFEQFERAPKTRRRFDGRFFVLKNPADFALASPGNSNHGWGLAFDLAVFHQHRVDPVRSSGAWDWVRANAERFGFSWELQSEPHHVRLVTGDVLPAAVRNHEDGTPIRRGSSITPLPQRPELIVSAPPFTPFELRRGVNDPHRVRWLQAVLNEREWGEPAVSGDFDATTESAVKVMQRDLGVFDDGRYGRVTATALAGFLARAVA